jgi:GNAT superfamily N-acetyltransferase
MELRRGTAADHPALMALFDEAVEWMVARGQEGQWGSEPWSARPSAVERARGMIESDGSWVIEHDGRAIAVLVVGEHPPHVEPVDRPELYIELLITSRAEAGQDLGGRLIRHARALAVERGAAVLRVDCWAGAPHLVRWYEDQGFHRSGTFRVGDWEGQVFEMPL